MDDDDDYEDDISLGESAGGNDGGSPVFGRKKRASSIIDSDLGPAGKSRRSSRSLKGSLTRSKSTNAMDTDAENIGENMYNSFLAPEILDAVIRTISWRFAVTTAVRKLCAFRHR